METFQNPNRNYFLIPYFPSVSSNNQGLLYFQKLWRVLCFLQRYNGICIKTIAYFAMLVQLIGYFCPIMELPESLQTINSKLWWHPVYIHLKKKTFNYSGLNTFTWYFVLLIKIQGWLQHDFASRNLEDSCRHVNNQFCLL